MHYYIYIHTIRSLIYIYIHINNYYFDGAMIPSLMKTICVQREKLKRKYRERGSANDGDGDGDGALSLALRCN